MAGREYPRQATPLSEAETAARLLAAHQRVRGTLPSRNMAELFLALMWNENARGQALYNHNWGNVIALGDQDYYRPVWYFQQTIDGVTDPKRKKRYQTLHDRMLAEPGTVPTKFRAYPDSGAGADRWIRTLYNDRYAATRRAANAGDADAFAIAHQQEGYCVDAACALLGPQYASLREDIRRAGFFNGLSNAGTPPASTGPDTITLRKGSRYRVTEVAYEPGAAAQMPELAQNVAAAGMTDFGHDADEQGRVIYWFTTPVLREDWTFPRVTAHSETVQTERLNAAGTRVATRSQGSSGAAVLAILLLGIGIAATVGRRAA